MTGRSDEVGVGAGQEEIGFAGNGGKRFGKSFSVGIGIERAAVFASVAETTDVWTVVVDVSYGGEWKRIKVSRTACATRFRTALSW